MTHTHTHTTNTRRVTVVSPNDERNWAEYHKHLGEFHIFKHNEHYATFEIESNNNRVYFNDEQAIKHMIEALEEEGL